MSRLEVIRVRIHFMPNIGTQVFVCTRSAAVALVHGIYERVLVRSTQSGNEQAGWAFLSVEKMPKRPRTTAVLGTLLRNRLLVERRHHVLGQITAAAM